MAPKKHGGSSDSSSSDETVTGHNPVPKRSYECSFCKRGFTNAQALGGHMNIHRRDRHKLSSANRQPAAAALVNYDTYVPSGWEAHLHHRQQLYFQQPVQLPSSHRQRLQSVNGGEEVIWGANLSLRVGEAGSGQDEDEVSRRVWRSDDDDEDDDMDLELRLGPHPL